MSRDLEEAKKCLIEKGYTCVVKREGQVYTSEERGVKPLLSWFDSEVDLTGFVAADKVVGKGAAMLYVLLGVRELYASVLSKPAKATLEQYGIIVCFDTCVEGIRNRAGTGPCPMEDAVKDIDTPKEALEAIRKRLAEM